MPRATPFASSATPVNVNGWTIEASPSFADASHPSTVRVQIGSSTRSRLTAAGFVALTSAIATYLAVGKVAAILPRSGANPGFCVTHDHAWVDVIPEDAATIMPAIYTVFQATANTTAQ